MTQSGWDAASEIASAAKRIGPYAKNTPLVHSRELSRLTGSEVYLKCENLQETGSFKFRGALNKIIALREKSNPEKVVAASNGNHGLAVASAAAKFGIEAVIYLSSAASAEREERIRGMGARVVRAEGGCEDAELIARAFADSEGLAYVSPYNDYHVVAGQGTLSFEILSQLGRSPDFAYISVGGGGLIGGAGAGLRSRCDCHVVGCWAENSPVMYECIKKGVIIDVPERPTISNSTSGGIEAGSVTFPICQKAISSYVLVSEEQIRSAMKLIADHDGQEIEGAAGVSVAALLEAGKGRQGKLQVVVLCGGNR